MSFSRHPTKSPGYSTHHPLKHPNSSVQHPTRHPISFIQHPTQHPESSTQCPTQPSEYSNQHPTQHPNPSTQHPTHLPNTSTQRSIKHPSTSTQHPTQPPKTSTQHPTKHPNHFTQHPTQPPISFVQHPTLPPESSTQCPSQPTESSTWRSTQHTESSTQRPTKHPKPFIQLSTQPTESSTRRSTQPTKCSTQRPIKHPKPSIQHSTQASESCILCPTKPTEYSTQRPTQPTESSTQRPTKPPKPSTQWTNNRNSEQQLIISRSPSYTSNNRNEDMEYLQTRRDILNRQRRSVIRKANCEPEKHEESPTNMVLGDDIGANADHGLAKLGSSMGSPSGTRSGESPEFAALVSRLKMGECRQTKLTLQDVLNIGQESMNDIELRTVEDIPWYFLQNVMALNVNARNTTFKEPAQSDKIKDSLSRFQCYDDDEETDSSDSVHPRDVLCVLLNCSDHFLQQEIVTKMSTCQFAVPLLLPAGDGSNCTFMLWAMRDLVKRWRPRSLADSKGFMEDNVVNIPMPIFSFVRLGTCTLSKSKFLNHLLSPTHSHYSIFVNQDMDCGNYPGKVSDGLVEISWFFPGGSGSSETFPEPFAVTNLHGDLESNLAQFTFLTQISATVFIFIESFTEEHYILFTKLRDTDTNYYFILSPSNDKQKMQISGENLKKLSSTLKVFIIKPSNRNLFKSVSDIQEIISDSMKDKGSRQSLASMAIVANRYGIKVDEDSVECQNARKHALSITSEIKHVAQYKKENMQLQGDLWKEISGLEKEMCRMKNQGRCNTTIYRNQLVKKCFDLTKTQYQHQMPEGIKNFLTAITHLTETGKCYFMKWLKFYLDSIARRHGLKLQAEYRRKSIAESTKENELKRLSQDISYSSLGIEHFIREMGQFYEVECSMIKQEQISPKQKQFSHLPGIAADLLLGGFPLELIDGDVSNIPLQWIESILNELETKTKGQCRMRVITVLGVQSTGKSTLLNTMFGLQFPVSSGRCTRGAFMTLIKVKEEVQQELGCGFILVIDTEGLKAPELSSLEDSYEHDNELATFVVGLSDITIINMAMENMAEMKDTLQIVVHAFLRMSEVGKKPNFHLVHQNVSDVTVHTKNEVGRENFLNELNEMTQRAAQMEKRNKSMKFCDIIDFDTEKHSWYFPGLWHGVPPMAIINQGYSENVFQLKKYLFTLLKERQSPEPQNINSFMEWTKSLWNAVKHETFIFSFRNILVAEAYDQMSVKYSELEWNFRKKVHSNLAKYENIIKNQLPENLQNVTSDILEKRIKELLDREETHMTQTLEQFFKSGCANVHLIERYRGDFLIYVKSLRKDLEVMASNKCWEAVRIQNVKSEIQIIQTKIQQFIEEKVTKHLQNHRMNHSTPNERELKLEFNALWDNILQEFNMTRLRKHRIEIEMLEQLKREMKNRPGAVTEKLNNVKSLKYYEQKSFEMNNIYMDHGFFWNIVEFITKDCYKKLSHIAHSLAEDCQVYVNEKINTEEDYNEMYCQNLLDMINHKLDEEEVRKLHPTPQFEVDLKLHVLGGAAPLFQNMHDNFGINNDPIRVTNKFKPQYFSIFKNRMLYKDKSRRHAEHFCEQCLKPAIKEHTYKNLGKEIIDDMLKCADAMMFSSRKHFQLTLLKELLEINRFENYLRYVTKYDNYVKRWISKYIVKKYNNSAELDNLVSQIVSSIGKKIKAALQEPIVQSSQSVSQMLQVFSMELKKDLVLSKSAMKVTSFQNISNIRQFSTDIAYFLDSTEEEIKSSIISMGIEDVLPKLTFKPQDELCQKIIGCGKRCPFCDAPCEAGGNNHQYHFSSFHRPKGLAPYKCSESNILCNSTCSADVFSNDSFINSDTDGKWLQYKDYRTIYPNWVILPDRDLNSSDYWKFVLKQFNDSFAKYYNVEPADIPSEWKRLTQKQALSSLQENMK